MLESRFRGPVASANGGYAAGRLAALMGSDAVEVTLRLPPPLDHPLRVERDGDAMTLMDGDAVVVEARAATLDLEAPEPVSLADAEEAAARHVRGFSADFAECFVCGLRDDGLGIHVGAVDGREPLHAAPVVLSESTTELVWAAIDCPGAYAIGAEGRGDIVLGRMTAHLHRLPAAGEPCAVASWPLGEDGRKLYAGTALFSGAGELLALAKQIWIVPRS